MKPDRLSPFALRQGVASPDARHPSVLAPDEGRRGGPGRSCQRLQILVRAALMRAIASSTACSGSAHPQRRGVRPSARFGLYLIGCHPATSYCPARRRLDLRGHAMWIAAVERADPGAWSSATNDLPRSRDSAPATSSTRKRTKSQPSVAGPQSGTLPRDTRCHRWPAVRRRHRSALDGCGVPAVIGRLRRLALFGIDSD